MMVLSHRHLQESAVKKFIDQYSSRITGVLSCFDRILFKGYLPLGWPAAMEGLLARRGLKIKDFKSFVMTQSDRIKQHAERCAQQAGRPFLYLNGRVRKEDFARDIARRDGITQGLVCVFRALEPCQTFKMVPGEGRPQLISARRKCLCYYFYFLDRELGLMHVRIQSWFPLVIQICINGHDWLARKLDRHGIAYRREDNAFLWIEDCGRAQKFADRFTRRNWPRVLAAFARRVNPLLQDVLRGLEYYWVMDQAEYATDVMFESTEALQGLYPQWLKHATLCFSAEDVLTFLGRKLHGRFAGEVLTDMKQKRYPGARVKHRMKENWIKMYDKFGCVLRIETVINHPREFKVRRRGKRQGQQVLGWFPLAKGVANMPRYREVCLAANRRYLDALATAGDANAARQQIRRLGERVRDDRRSHRALNPANEHDVQLMAAVMRGEHTIHGFTNAHVRAQLCPPTRDPAERRRQSQRIGRLLKLLHAHRLIARIPRSRRWRVTSNGWALMTTILRHHHHSYPDTLAAQAA